MFPAVYIAVFFCGLYTSRSLGVYSPQKLSIFLRSIHIKVAGGLHLELVHGLARIGDHNVVALVVRVRHDAFLLFSFWFVGSWMEHPLLAWPPAPRICVFCPASF